MLLSLLAEAPMYGYQLAREIEARSGGYFRLKGGTLYPALRRLELDGLVQGQWRWDPGQQQRRYYFITDQGLQALSSRTTYWRDFARAVTQVILPAPSPAT